MTEFVQLPVAQNSQNVCLRAGVWLESPDQVSIRLGIQFEELEDDFLPMKGASIQFQDTGARCGFRRYEPCPDIGVEILLYEYAENPAAELSEVMSKLGIPTDKVRRYV